MNEQQSVADPSAESSEQEDVIFDSTDWEEEAERIGSNDWFSPKPGSQTVRFLDEGEEQTREYDDEVRDVQVFTVKVGGDELKWSVTKGETESSLWGQLVKVAVDREGLEGEELTLIRNGAGSDTQYTVQEAAELE
jgi:hypothetical protein